MIMEAVIRGRRSLGRNLAFMDISPTATNENNENTNVQVSFRTSTFSDESTTKFPVKNSQMPNGALIQLEINSDYEVIQWNILKHPREEALQKSITNSDNDQEQQGISYKKYMTYRGSHTINTKKSHISKQQRARKSKIKTSNRFKLFATYLHEKFLPLLNEGENKIVLDVAGGKGQLSIELSLLNMYQQAQTCIVIDPFIRHQPIPKKTKKLFAKHSLELPVFQHVYFDKKNSMIIEQVQSCTCLIGLHPDEPTEDILRLALEYNKPCAIVPCCVFADLNPHRVLNHQKVRSYDEFLLYLMQLDSRITRHTLDGLDGKNQILTFIP